MPALFPLLAKTMMFSTQTPPTSVAPGDAVPSPTPNPTFTEDVGLRLVQPLWSWSHDPSRPATLTDISCRMRGMGMQYRHAMPVLTNLSFDEVTITLRDDTNFVLQLEPRFALRKVTLSSGHIPPDANRLFPLEKELDASVMVVFGYEWDGQAANPISQDDAGRDDFMPPPGGNDEVGCGVDQQVTCFVGRPRIVVVCEFVFCKERNDFVPAGIVGVAKIYPHAYVMSNVPLKEARVVIALERPAHATRHDSEMLLDILPKVITDTNTNSSPLPGPLGTTFPFLPLWDQIFDYYDLDPVTRIGTGTPMKVVDSTQRRVRTIPQAIKKLKPGLLPTDVESYVPATIVKMPRQGEFDNLHLAPRMKVAALEPPNGAHAMTPARFFGDQLDSIAMAPFCLHDCFHLHVRWGLPTFTTPAADRWNMGFGPSGAYTDPGAPAVPLNQDVFLTLLSQHAALYEGVASPAEAGAWHVFCHHGMGYAVDFWLPPVVEAMRSGAEAFAKALVEENFFPVTAVNSFALFYWRLRFGGIPQNPAERVLILNPGLCRT